MEQTEGYNPGKSKLSADKLADFIRAPITNDIADVPSIGSATKELLRNIVVSANNGEMTYEIGNLETTYQLCGLFLMMKGENILPIEHADRFYYFLLDIGVQKRLIPDIVKAICNKLSVSFPEIYNEDSYET